MFFPYTKPLITLASPFREPSAITGAIRKVLKENPEKFDPRDYLKPARTAMKAVCVARMIAFGQAGNASKLRQSVAV